MNLNSLFSFSDHLEKLSKDGYPLEVLHATMDFEYFRGWFLDGLGYGDGSNGGHPPFDPVSIFKALILQAQICPGCGLPPRCDPANIQFLRPRATGLTASSRRN